MLATCSYLLYLLHALLKKVDVCLFINKGSFNCGRAPIRVCMCAASSSQSVHAIRARRPHTPIVFVVTYFLMYYFVCAIAKI
jgi:hypothetical protein